MIRWFLKSVQPDFFFVLGQFRDISKCKICVCFETPHGCPSTHVTDNYSVVNTFIFTPTRAMTTDQAMSIAFNIGNALQNLSFPSLSHFLLSSAFSVTKALCFECSLFPFISFPGFLSSPAYFKFP